MRVVLMFFLCVMSLGLAHAAFGSDAKPVVEAEPDFTTDYTTTSYRMAAKTKTQSLFKGSFAITSGYPFDSMAEHLRSFPFIMSITRHLSKELKPKETAWGSYFVYKRESIVFINLALSKPVTIMMSLEEGYKDCVSKSEGSSASASNDERGTSSSSRSSSSSSSSSCRPDSNFKLKGPIKVYSESLVGSGDIKNLLKGQIEIKSNFSRSTSNELLVDTSMKRPNKLFDLTYDALNKLQIPMNWGGPNNEGYQTIGSRGYVSEHQISLSIVRFFRLANERLLKQIKDEDRRGEE